ncbi:MAG: hypothetical protein PHV13_02760 [Candidatus ainarchaeum sp.]|nr:hypothetical protein [Candidatus ainarchaeum sp.]
MISQRTAPPLKRESMLNPFAGKVLGSNGEALTRSFHLAVRGAYLKTATDKPALALFAYSSGYPIRMAFDAVGRVHGLPVPPRLMLPLTSHHVHREDKPEFLSDFKGMRKRLFDDAADDVADALHGSENPSGPIYLIDEVLSGACVTNIRKMLMGRLVQMGIFNEIKILALASQKDIVFDGSFSIAAHDLAAASYAYVHPEVYGRKDVTLRPRDVQLTVDGLDVLISAGVASFKASCFNDLVSEKIATVFPVLDLFTTDNLMYDPLLFLDRERRVLKATSRSFSQELKESTSTLLHQCGVLEEKYGEKEFSRHVATRTPPQGLPRAVRDQI